MNKEKVLIIKTGYTEFLDYDLDSRIVSLGDVLRATPILHLFKEDHVSWATDSEAAILLEENPFIDRLLVFDQFLPFQLGNERFDTVINLEKVPGICALVNNIQAWKKYGFRFDSETGTADAYNHAFDALIVAADPKVKRSNLKFTQQLLFAIVGQEWRGEEYVLGYKPRTEETYDISFNVKVGSKWPNKAWPREKWDSLEKIILSKGFSVTRQDQQDPKLFKDLRGYMDWINRARLMITNDSLGMHLALALRKKVIALFGPTSEKEIYFYGRGKAIVPEGNYPCLPCFNSTCEKEESCMERISPERVYSEIKKQLTEKK